jgi:hypothetical protein
VRDRAETFLDQQTFLRQGEVDAAPHLLARDAVIIAVGIVTKKGEAEAIFAARRTMTSARVATGLRQRRDHVQPEADGLLHVGALDRHGDFQDLSAKFDLHFGLSIFDGVERVVLQARERLVAE